MQKENSTTIVPLVTHYSFDTDCPVQLFTSQEKAQAELKRQFEEELIIQTEENGHVQGEDLEVKRTDEWTYAAIIIDFNGSKDVIEWTIGRTVETVK